MLATACVHTANKDRTARQTSNSLLRFSHELVETSNIDVAPLHLMRSKATPVGMNEHRNVSLNTLWLLVDRGGRLAIAFFLGIWVARQLGPASFGVLTYAQALISVISFLNLAAIEAIVVRMLVDEPSRHDEILGSAVLLRVAGGLAAILTSVVLVYAMNAQGDLVFITPVIACTTLFQSVDVVDYWFRRILRSRYGVIARLLALLIGAILRIFATTTADPLRAVALAIAAESILVAIALTFAMRRTGASVMSWRPSWQRAVAIVRQSSAILLSAVAIAIYVRFGFIVLGNVAGSDQVGQLSVASTVAETLHALPVAFVASYGPILMGIRLTAPDAFQLKFRKLLQVFTVGSLLLALSVSLIAPWLMPFAFGKSYAASGTILSILVWSIVFVYISVASELWFVGNSLQRYLLPKTVVSAAAYLVLVMTLIPLYGAKGAAVATLITYSISAYWSNLIFQRRGRCSSGSPERCCCCLPALRQTQRTL